MSQEFDRVAFAERAFLTLLQSSPEIEMNEQNLRVLAQYAFVCADQFQEAMLDDDDEEPEGKAAGKKDDDE